MTKQKEPKKRKKLSIRVKIPLVFCGILAIVICSMSAILIGYYYKTFYQTMTNSISSTTEANAYQLRNLLDTVDAAINMVNDNQETVLTDGGNNFSIIEEPLVTFERKEDQSDLYDISKQYSRVNTSFNDLFNVVLNLSGKDLSANLIIFDRYPVTRLIGMWKGFDFDQIGIQSEGSAKDQDWYQETIAMQGENYWFRQNDYPTRIFLARELHYQVYQNMQYDIRPLGICVISFDVSWMDEHMELDDISEKTQFYLTDENHKIVYSGTSSENHITEDDAVLMSETLSDGKTANVRFHDMPYLVKKDNLGHGLWMVTFVPQHDLTANAFHMVQIILILSAIALLFGILVMTRLSDSIAKPIVRLTEQMKGHMPVEIKTTDNADDEIGIMFSEYNRMQNRIQNLLIETKELAQKQKNEEINALQAQMNPHFLFNTLGMVSSLALMHKEDQIAEEINHLTKIIRYNMRDPEGLVPLSQEIDMIKEYEQIQKLTYEDMVVFIYEISEETQSLMIPKMVIQPLVENAIVHRNREDNKLIYIKVSSEICSNNVLVIRVTDNGKNVDTETINRYLHGECEINTDRKSFGTRNIYQRLRLRFGEDGDLYYSQDQEGNTQALVRIRFNSSPASARPDIEKTP